MKAPKFNREQIKYIVCVAIGVALDKLESSLPYNTSDADWKRLNRQSLNWSGYCAFTAAFTAGQFLSVLYAGQTDDGISAGDAISLPKANIQTFVMDFPEKQIAYWNKEVKPKLHGQPGGIPIYHPLYQQKAIEKLADKWIGEVFGKAFFK